MLFGTEFFDFGIGILDFGLFAMRKKYRAAILLFSVFFIGFLLSCGEKPHPKDAEMIANFQNHREEFNQLLQMFQEDESLGRVANDFNRKNFYEKGSPKKWDGKEIEVSEQRFTEYRKLFGKLGLSAGIEGYEEKDSIWFHASAQGLAVSGSSKGYVFMLNKPVSDLVVESLNDYKPNGKESTLAYRHIEGNWYLYYAAD